MSVSATQAQHLERVELSGSKIDTILSQLGEWLPNAKFDLDGKVDKCADAELYQRCLPLFIELGILTKARRISFTFIIEEVCLTFCRFALSRPELITM
ncbi:hypothetical protein CJF31_00011379 [Rutstroemia sp. NJR-2017a BVV2]|nr:hypothetical protein CJF31_00011379 [Rutstroemia sp. NJR-2017a BVV2]